MAIPDLPVMLHGFKIMVTEVPTMKMRRQADGSEIPATDRAGNPQYIVTVFVKPQSRADGRKVKGEEVKVNLGSTAPVDAFEEGDYVELINPVVNTYEMTNDQGRITGSGLWWKADGVKHATRASKAA